METLGHSQISLTLNTDSARLAEAAGCGSDEDRRDSGGLVCQFVCRARARRDDVSGFVRESGEPNVRELEPAYGLATCRGALRHAA